MGMEKDRRTLEVNWRLTLLGWELRREGWSSKRGLTGSALGTWEPQV